jgi:predicted O-methyltransferase YrrM
VLLVKNKWIRKLFGILETGNLLFLKLLMKNPAAAARYPGEVFRSYMSLVGQDHWACLPIFEVLPTKDEFQITITHLSSDVIETPLEQLACLAMLTKAKAPSVVFEIGTFRGRTALNFALNSPSECTVYTLDLPPDARQETLHSVGTADSAIIRASETGCDYRGKPVEHKIKQLFGNSQTFDFSPYFGQCDLVYIDGAHHYEAVRRDSANAVQMVKPGGFVLWDEFANYGDYNDVTRAAIDELGPNQIVQIEKTQLAAWRKPLSPAKDPARSRAG